MDDYIFDLIYKEMYKCENLDDKKAYLQHIINELESTIMDMNCNPWEYE